MNKKFTAIIISVFLVILNTSFAQEKSIVLGGKDGWPLLSKMQGIVSGKGKFGYDAMVLATNSRTLDNDTDILIDFEGNEIKDIAGNYSVEKNHLRTSSSALMGKKAGLAKGKGGITLRGNKDSMFGKQGICGSFLIEFWLKPSIAENGEVVFSWRSSRTVANYPLYQMIVASFFKNHLEWSFTNVFNGYTENQGELTLCSYRTIVPETWMHHSISFDQETGVLEYRINGLLEALKYVTTNGHEFGGSVYTPVFGVPASLDLCPQYTGLIDDFRIQRVAKSESSEELRIDNYKIDGGRFETQPILLSQGAKLTSIDALVDTPAQTDVQFFVRSGENFYNWTDESPEWIPVKNKESIENVSGLYFQIAAELLPDGQGSVSPSVTEIKINYKEIPAPLAPFKLTATPLDSSVVLSWPYSVDDSVGGYYVFYGERPGEYLGRAAVEGPSPIDVGNSNSIKLTGLKNGKIYYFAISSYSRHDSRVMGELSKEVFARPSKK